MPMFMGAMIAGPLGGWAIKRFDRWVDGKIKSGFEMLVNNFSAGIIGMLLAMLAFLAIGPMVELLSKALATGVNVMVQNNLLPLTSILLNRQKSCSSTMPLTTVSSHRWAFSRPPKPVNLSSS